MTIFYNPFFIIFIIIIFAIMDREEILIAFAYCGIMFMVIESYSFQAVQFGSAKYAFIALFIGYLRCFFNDPNSLNIRLYEWLSLIFLLIITMLQIIYPGNCTIYRVVTVLGFTVLPFLYLSGFRHNPEKIYRFMFYYGLFSIIGALFTLSSFTTIVEDSGSRIIKRLGIKNPELANIPLARCIGHAFLFCIAGFFVYKNRIIKIIMAGLVVLTSFLLITSLERGPLIGVIPVFIFWIFLAKFTRFKFYQTERMWGILLGVIACVTIPPFFYRHFYTTRLENVGLVQGGTRLEIFEWAYERFLNSPFIGNGLEFIVNNYYTHSHNVILQVAAEMGIVGLLIFFILIIGILKDAFYVIKHNNIIKLNYYITFAISLFIYDFFQAQVSGDLMSNYYIWIDLGLALSFVKYWQTRIRHSPKVNFNPAKSNSSACNKVQHKKITIGHVSCKRGLSGRI